MAQLSQPFNPSASTLPSNMGVALDYAFEGVKVIPCDPRPNSKCDDPAKPSKAPLAGWGDGKAGSSDPEVVYDWMDKRPNPLVGVPLGQHGLIAFDCDVRDGKKGVENFEALCAQHGGLPAGVVIIKTVSGGLHFIMRQPEGLRWGNGRGSLPRDIDVRGYGGYIIADGSECEAGSWRAIDGSKGLLQAIRDRSIPEMPEWLVAVLKGSAKRETLRPLSEQAVARINDDNHADGDERRFIEDAIACIPPDGRDEWLRVGMGLFETRQPWARDLWDAWSRRSSKFEAADQERTWRGFAASQKPNKLTIASVIELARKHGFDGHKYAPMPAVDADWLAGTMKNLEAQVGRQSEMQQLAPVTAADELPPLEFVPFSANYGEAPPQRRWLVEDWVPAEGEVTGLYGDGGIGKSMLAQLTQAVAALGLPWFGHAIKETRSLGIYCEDTADELWRRKYRILNHLLNGEFQGREDYALAQLSGAMTCSRVGMDNFLMVFAKNGKGEVTPFRNQIIERALDEKAELVILDNAATMFPGNMNDPVQVRQFVDIACGQIGMAIGGSVILCAHPSKSGLESGKGDSGSVQWNAAFRSRLYLKRPVDAEGDNSKLELTREKANYARAHSESKLRLKWSQAGVQILDAPEGAPFRPPARKIFLDLLDKRVAQGRFVSDKARGSTYAPRVFAKAMFKEACGYNVLDFAQAMEDLFSDGAIERAAVWTGERRRREYILRPGQCSDIRCSEDGDEPLDESEDLGSLEGEA